MPGWVSKKGNMGRQVFTVRTKLYETASKSSSENN